MFRFGRLRTVCVLSLALIANSTGSMAQDAQSLRAGWEAIQRPAPADPQRRPLDGGPVIIGGDDADDHGSFDPNTGVNLDGWLYIQVGFDLIGPNVTNGNAQAVCLGCGTGQGQDAFASGFDLSSLPGLGWTRTTLNDAALITAFFNGTGVVNINNTGLIYLPSDAANVDGGIPDGLATAVAPCGVNSFVTNGGGLFTHVQSATGWAWLQWLLPGVTTTGATSLCTESVLALTPAGAAQFPGLTDPILSSATPWHEWFARSFGGLDVLVTGPCVTGDQPVILGGPSVEISSGIALTPLTSDNFVGSSHTVTAKLVCPPGPAITVDFEVLFGPNLGLTGSAVTDPNDRAEFTYQGVGGFGVDVIVASYLDGAVTRTSEPVTKRWLLDIPPIGVDDCFATDPNTVLTTPAAISGGVLANDVEIPGNGDIEVDGADGMTPLATSQSGSVLLNLDGSFTYTPPAGFVGIDTFQYSPAQSGLTSFLPATTRINVGLNQSGGLRLPATIRDFPASHPDFEEDLYISGVVRGIVNPTLGPGRRPALASLTGNGAQQVVTDAASFAQWYTPALGVNIAYPITMIFAESTAQPGLFTFAGAGAASPALFFPINGLGFGNQGRPYNYHFTTEFRTQFVYEPGQRFDIFEADDDLWIFINDQLVVDLGGVHAPAGAALDLDAMAGDLGLVTGGIYPFDLFHAERHTVQSHLRFQTSLRFISCDAFTPPNLPGDADGDGDVDGDDFAEFSACMNGPNNAPLGDCAIFDFDFSGRIDVRDAAVFQLVFMP